MSCNACNVRGERDLSYRIFGTIQHFSSGQNVDELSGEGVDEGAEETERVRHHQDLQFIAHGGFLKIDFKTHFHFLL